MIAYDEIDVKQLKEVCKSANDSGLLPSKIKIVGSKNVAVYDEFIATIENLSEDSQAQLPDDVIDFFNYLITDEDEEELAELNFDGDVVPEFEDSMDDEKYDVIEEEDEIIEEKPVVANKDTSEKITRKTKTPMTPLIVDDIMTITFKEIGTNMSFKLPDKNDKDKSKLKEVRKQMMQFAVENDATKGQKCAISKELNIYGWYMR